MAGTQSFEGTVHDPVMDCPCRSLRVEGDYLHLRDMLDEVFGWGNAEGKRVRITLEPLETEADAPLVDGTP